VTNRQKTVAFYFLSHVDLHDNIGGDRKAEINLFYFTQVSFSAYNHYLMTFYRLPTKVKHVKNDAIIRSTLILCWLNI
jgi:hypothetical protein